MIRILFVIPTLDRSGAEKQMTLLATRLPAADFQPEVVALTRGGPYADDLARHGIPLTVLNKRLKFDPVALLRLRKLIRTRRPDVVHTWLFAANAYGRLAAGGRRRPRIIVSERCVDTWKAAWQHRVDRWLAARADRLVGNSQSVGDFYRDRGFPAERIRVIPNGIALPALDASARARVRGQLGIPDNAPVAIYVGRLARQKRVDDLIWSAELVRCIHADFRFLIVGDGPERPALQRYVRNLQAEHSVLFLGHSSEVAETLQAADQFWLASDFEGQSNSLMEAMSSALPVVASDIPPNRELVDETRTGLLTAVGDRAAFAQAALSLFADSDVARRMGQAGRERMSHEFSVEAMVARYADLYREVVTGTPALSGQPVVA
ncbi:MAG TPA: glycosyltransferase [Planctomycetaceae bacterium]|nr:glycosyltransferase [Planctomycetaceae bacterium]